MKFATAPKGSSTSASYLLNAVRICVVILKVSYTCCKVMCNRSDTSCCSLNIVYFKTV